MKSQVYFVINADKKKELIEFLQDNGYYLYVPGANEAQSDLVLANTLFIFHSQFDNISNIASLSSDEWYTAYIRNPYIEFALLDNTADYDIAMSRLYLNINPLAGNTKANMKAMFLKIKKWIITNSNHKLYEGLMPIYYL